MDTPTEKRRIEIHEDLHNERAARTTLLRRTVTGHTVDTNGGFGDRLYGCDYCGHIRRTPKGHPQAYRYVTQSDGGRSFDHAGRFCSKSCHDSYHG